MKISRIMSSGRSAEMILRASSPPEAVTTSKPREPRLRRTNRRILGSSSTTRIRLCFPFPEIFIKVEKTPNNRYCTGLYYISYFACKGQLPRTNRSQSNTSEITKSLQTGGKYYKFMTLWTLTGL